MSQVAATPKDGAPFLFQLQIPGMDGPLHGVTFDSQRRLVMASGARLARVVPHTGRVVDELETFPAPGGIAYDGCYLWQHIRGRFQQLDVRTALVVRSVAPKVDDVTGLECIEGDLLVLHGGGRLLARVQMMEHAESVEATITADVPTGAPLRGLTWSLGELWSAVNGALVAVDPVAGHVYGRLSLPAGVQACDLAGDLDGRLWCVDGDSRVVRVFAQPGSAEWRLPEPAWSTETYRPAHTSSGAMRVAAPAASAMATAEATFARVLVPIDFSAGSRRALAIALALQESVGSEVHLFHLAEPGANDEFLAGIGGTDLPPSELVEAARARLRGYVEDAFPRRSADVEVHAHFGSDAVSGIKRTAGEVGATLVLLAGRARQSMLRTHIEKIVRGLQCTVMVLRTEETKPPSPPSDRREKALTKVVRIRDVVQSRRYDLAPERRALRVPYDIFHPSGEVLVEGADVEWAEGEAIRRGRFAETTLGDCHPGERVLVRLPSEASSVEWRLCDVEAVDGATMA